jgi:type II secretory pathway pseudopilin PulG
MSGERGYTIVELLVAAAVMLTVLAGVSAVLHDAILRVPWLEESTDLQQRTRAVVEQLSADLRAAGAGGDAGSLASYVPVVLPRASASPPTAASASVLTVRYIPADGAVGRLTGPLLPADTTVALAGGGACVSNAIACGFRSGTTALVFDGTGQADVLMIDAIAPGVISTSTVLPRLASYGAGADVAELHEVTYTLNGPARVLERRTGASSLPLADNVTALAFEYHGAAGRPSVPQPPPGTANCLYAGDGTYLHPVMGSALPQVLIDPAELVDGPFCGVGPLSFDVDLMRIRTVRVRLRLDTGADALRGTDPRFFARPGQARDTRVIHDVDAAFTLSLRNVGR